MDIYERIFEIVNENLIQNGSELPFSKEKYLRIVRQNPYEITIEDVEGIRTDSDIDAFFYRALNRLSDSNTNSSIHEMGEIVKQRFPDSMGILVAIVVSGSVEFKIKHKKMLWDKEERFENRRLNRIIERKLIRNRLEIKIKKRQLCSALGWKLFKNNLEMYKSKFYQHVVFKIWDLFPNNIKNVIRRLMGRKEK